MELQTNPDLRVLDNMEIIPENAICYCLTDKGMVGWCSPGPHAGRPWNKHSMDTPAIVMAPRGKKKH